MHGGESITIKGSRLMMLFRLIDSTERATTGTVRAIDVKSLQAIICLQAEQFQEKNKKLQEQSTATLASISASSTAIPKEFLSSGSGISDDVVLELEDWMIKTRKIWSAKLQVELEALFLPQNYYFYHNDQAIQVLLISSFGPNFLKHSSHKPPLQFLI